MKVFIALFAVVAVAVANPLPLVQLIVNVDAPAGYNPIAIDGPINPNPVIEKPVPEFVIPGPVNVVDNVDAEPIVVPEPVVLPAPVLPIVVPEPVVLPAPVLPVVVPEPVVLPAPVLPEVVIPEEVIVEAPASIPIGIVNPVETIIPEEVIIAVPVVSPSVMDH